MAATSTDLTIGRERAYNEYMILYPNETQTTNEWRPQYPNRPLVFLDVDGVINWSPKPTFLKPEERRELYEKIHISTNGVFANIKLPFWMPRLISYLTDVAEVVWLTAWKEVANPGLAELLGIRELATITDGLSAGGYVDWKVEHMTPVATEAHENGREVVWIEDFGFDMRGHGEVARNYIYKGIPEFVQIVDTLPIGVLRWEDLDGTAVEADEYSDRERYTEAYV